MRLRRFPSVGLFLVIATIASLGTITTRAASQPQTSSPGFLTFMMWPGHSSSTLLRTFLMQSHQSSHQAHPSTRLSHKTSAARTRSTGVRRVVRAQPTLHHGIHATIAKSSKMRFHTLVSTATNTTYSAQTMQMLSLINSDRAQASDGPLTLDVTLSTIAQGRSQDMISRNYFSHTIPGSPPTMVFDILDKQHISYSMVGENIALNNYIDFYSRSKTVDQTNTDLMNSPEHRANLLEPKFTHLGLGIAFDSSGKMITTEIFTSPS